MKLQCLVLILLSSSLNFSQATIPRLKPLTKSQLQQLVAAGMDNQRLAKTVEERGIDFELSGDYLASLREKGALPVLLRAVGNVGLKKGQYPLDKDMVRELLTAGIDSLALARAVMERGIDFQPVTEYLQGLQTAGAVEALLKALREALPKPLGKDQLLGLLASGVASERVGSLVQRRGINFKPSEEYMETLRIAGANEAVIRAVREAKRPPEFVLVKTLEGHENTVRSIAFSPDGRYLASGSVDATVKLWEVEAAHEARTLAGHRDMVTAVAFSPDSRSLASAGIDETVRIWEVNTGREPRTLTGHTSEVYSVSFSPDGRRLASGGLDGTVRIWEMETSLTVLTLKGRVGKAVVFSPDGKLLAGTCYDNTIRLWESDTGRETLVLKGHADAVNSLAFSPDGRYLASASSDKTIMLWDVGTGRQTRTFTGHESAIWCVAFTPDGKYLASGSADGTLRLWEVDSGLEVARLLNGPMGTVPALAFRSDGRYFAAGHDDQILLWKVEE
ncbi:MAG: WD40 repeat domain-containing protein [Acidobacteriia bacterium]|nr:WD40 repeat domain-containing protein [Terriglobia bacterium]